MKKEKIVDAMNDIDDEYIKEAKQKKKFVFDWAFVGKLLTGVACVLLVVTIVPSLIESGRKATSNAVEMSYDTAASSQTPAAAFPMEEAVAEAAYVEESNGSFSLAGGDVKADVSLLENKKLIVNGNINLETTNFDELIETLNKNVQEVGGYIQNSSISTNYNSNRYYDASIRIPADKYQDFVSKAKQSANVTWYNESVNDITDTYTNLEARLKSLKAEEEKVLEFYDKAQNLEELMSVESRLTNIRYEIDSIENSIKNYDLQINYSTLYVSIQETKVYTNTKTTFLQRVGMAFSNGFTNFIEGVQDLFVGVVYNLWTIIIVIVLVIVAIIVIKKVKNRKK